MSDQAASPGADDGAQIEIQNPTYNVRGTIDCTIIHPVHGPLPFTASPDDDEPFGREIYARAVAMGPASFVASQDDLIAYADQKHAAVMAGGCVINGVPVATTIRGMTLLNGAVSRAEKNPSAIANWVVGPDQTIALDAATAIALGLAVGDWIQTTYDALSAVYAQIRATTITTFAQIDAAQWPSNT
ncbi:hypothetical protein [Hyphomicrobium sp. MC8b]|uniref:DUF4376 domain-containing protein n=1 Tax=Hyphomicrobium sp. MC8b TaxID=300273 RepID=UPI00391CC2EC